MPVKPENLARYPADWPEIRERILTRAGQRRGPYGRIDEEAKCEECGVENHIYGYYDEARRFVPVGREPTQEWDAIALDGHKTFRIVLTVAHLGHAPENCADDNLRAWCQRCHNRYYRAHRNKTAKATRREYGAKAGQMELDGMKGNAL